MKRDKKATKEEKQRFLITVTLNASLGGVSRGWKTDLVDGRKKRRGGRRRGKKSKKEWEGLVVLLVGGWRALPG